jgi:hypothetical protein
MRVWAVFVVGVVMRAASKPALAFIRADRTCGDPRSS